LRIIAPVGAGSPPLVPELSVVVLGEDSPEVVSTTCGQ